VTEKRARAVLSHPAVCGVSRAHLGDLIEESAGPWLARCESALRERRGAARRRAAGAGPKRDLVFADRVLVTLVHLRTGLPHAPLAELYGTARSTVSRAIGEIRPLQAARGFAVPDRPGVRPRTLADVFVYSEAEGVRLRIDGAESPLRRELRCMLRHGVAVGVALEVARHLSRLSRHPWSQALSGVVGEPDIPSPAT
jgi:hypothetical protein